MHNDDVENRVELALQYPWTVTVTVEDGELIARVKELPDAVACAADHGTLEKELWEAIRASLRARIEFGDPVPQSPIMETLRQAKEQRVYPMSPAQQDVTAGYGAADSGKTRDFALA